jgi:hypothetical protein
MQTKRNAVFLEKREKKKEAESDKCSQSTVFTG